MTEGLTPVLARHGLRPQAKLVALEDERQGLTQLLKESTVQVKTLEAAAVEGQRVQVSDACLPLSCTGGG